MRKLRYIIVPLTLGLALAIIIGLFRKTGKISHELELLQDDTADKLRNFEQKLETQLAHGQAANQSESGDSDSGTGV